MTAVKIPYEQLSTEALHGVIEQFVTRDGTGYGEVEIPLYTINGHFRFSRRVRVSYLHPVD
ncbi:hypothetical protein DO021_15325 [Desulfobacter hydrogenophilus]|uniref:Uncharacterized protein n=1 Tax=Desulfobacter hydrogenophilus TaxID=2291 RepID=A0A328FDR2_9BACT|nr:YheU family protein [Desulfobacter hydrogenophilus]NDY72869.1 YheU family protein [Desulfobacter hydrogenophilus]QBH13598.1 hypothetical protein EYB58_12080 [Desulfobacter hydrogenophilus]RAM01177.1 hypothetical protein DO021_15325 [Desulfobacter hydrogenophilus]